MSKVFRYFRKNIFVDSKIIIPIVIGIIIGIIILIVGILAITNQESDIADTIYVNGKIYTVNDAEPWAEAVAIRDGKFIKVGSFEEVNAFKGAKSEIIDLEGKFVMPGMSKPLLLTILNVQ